MNGNAPGIEQLVSTRSQIGGEILGAGFHSTRESFETGAPARAQAEYDDGRCVEAETSPIKGSESSVKFVVKVVRDITERTRTERELDQLYGALEELEAFSYTVSHDLRAPVRAANLQMKQLIDHLSGLSRASREPMSRRCVLLTRLANDVLDDASIRNPGLPITAEVQQGMSAHGDRHMLKIVIENPVSNAVKYSKSTGAARIRFFSTQQESGRAFHISGTEEWEDETA